MLIQITYHAQSRIADRTNLTLDQVGQAYTQGLALQAMPSNMREYLLKRKPNYTGHRYLDSEYRLYMGFIFIYRVHPNGGLALITSLVPPAYTLLETTLA